MVVLYLQDFPSLYCDTSNATQYSTVKRPFFPRSLSLDLLTFRKLRNQHGNIAAGHWQVVRLFRLHVQAEKRGSNLQGGAGRINIAILKGG
jgi:hypothetical protein